MWDYHRPRKPIYRRPWFLALLLALGLIALVGTIYFFALKREYDSRIAQFDLKRLRDMESASIIYDRNNNVLGKIFIQNRDTISFDDIPYSVIQAVLAAEDNRFFQHHGADYYGMLRAALKNYRAGRIRQGASTLTQQLARNTYRLSERTYGRKLLEILLARAIEDRFSKNEILEFYLNRVYFGGGFYGIEAASRGYFGKRAREMNLSESATLAGLLKSPSNLSPWSNRQACVSQRNFVLGRMLELKMITSEQYELNVAENLAVKNRSAIHADSYALDMIRQQVIARVGLDGATSDGYRIYTTIDSELQKKAESSLEHELGEVEKHKGFQHQTYAQYEAIFRAHKKAEAGETAELPGPEYLQGGLVALDNANGSILALIGGRDFAHSQFNRATSAARPAGTAFKPLVYAAAFEKGIFPGALFQDSIIDNRQVMIGGTTGILGEWGPERVDNKYEGPIPARYALVKSKNAATVRLGMQTGLENVIDLAARAGISSPLRKFPATFLGSSEVTLMDLTLSYTMFPNEGWRPEKPFIIKRIEEKGGRVVFEEKPGRRSVIRDTSAYEIHSCLSEALERGSADKAFSEYGLKKFPVGGKTGTAYNFTDAWFVGYSSAITCGVWAGFDKPQPIYRGAFSSEIALPVWVEVMNSTFANYKPKEIVQPRGIIKCEVCLSSGLLATPKCVETDNSGGESVERRTTYFEICTEAQAPKDPCNVHGGGGRIVKADPAQQGEWPRAALAVDVASVDPVAIKAPTVVGADDPYNSIKPSAPLAANKPAPIENGVAPEASPDEKPPEEVEVRRAEIVRPIDQTPEENLIQIDPPAPIDF
jgi:1A family penicillin-binding protein